MPARPLTDAWADALYGVAGFYRQPEGPAGHFATSAQGLPGVDELLAECVVALCRAAGMDRIVEIGCGRGELLSLLHQIQPEIQLLGVDIVDRPPQLPAAIQWLRSPGGAVLPAQLAALDSALVLAHEWLDVVPCPITVRTDNGLRTTAVTEAGEVVPDRALSAAEQGWLDTHWPDTDSAEIGLSRDQAYAELRSRIHGGLLVCVDYGHVAGDRPDQPTFTGYRAGAQCAPTFDGSTDLTAHVAVDSLGADRLIRQRDLAYELLDAPERPNIALAQSDPNAYVAALRRRGAWSAFTAPERLGGFWWTLDQIGS